MRILYVHSSFVPPPLTPASDRFYLLSEKLEGDVLQPIWFGTPAEVEAMFGPGSYPSRQVGKFRYHWFLVCRYPVRLRRLATFWFYLRKGMALHRERRFDCIVTYGHMTAAVISGILKFLTGAKLIVEIATSPKQVYLTDRPKPTLRERLMHVYSDCCLHISTLLLANRAHFLVPGQLSDYPLLRRVRNSVFHEFVPLSIVERNTAKDDREPFVLLIGAPWYLKGVDLLIAAFKNLAPDFPGVKLKLLGHFPDRAQLNEMIGGSPQIEILEAQPHPEAVRTIARSTVLVLASRCEGMGRVLIEGMAAGVPLVGSDVGGIPYMIRDGENGFVFPSGDIPALEARLRRLLSDPELRRRMGQRGFERARDQLNEKVYVEEFAKMVEAAVREED